MPVLHSMPSPEIVRLWRGQLDYYCYRGLACVRKWPRRPKMPRSAASQLSAAVFATFAAIAPHIDDSIMAQLLEDTAGTTWTWRDELTRAAYGHLIVW